MGALVKWLGGNSAPETALEKWRRLHGRQPIETPPRGPVVPANDIRLIEPADMRLDLPRRCCVTNGLWCARYLREGPGLPFRYIRSVVMDGRIRVTLYGPDDLRALPGDFDGDIEDCPLCGAYTRDGSLGAVWCPRCRSWRCYGLTSREGFFICGCGFRGWLARNNQTRLGMVLR